MRFVSIAGRNPTTQEEKAKVAPLRASRGGRDAKWLLGLMRELKRN